VSGPRTDVPRDKFGRPLVIPPGGGNPVAYRRCTTFIDVLGDRYALEKWKLRQVAIGLTARPDLLLKVASVLDDKDELNATCDAAMEAVGSSAKATIGTAIHALTEQIDRGKNPAIPPMAQADIAAYVATTCDIAMREIEVFVVNDALHVGGTFDRVVEYGGDLYIADVKTGGIDFDGAKIAMQLAVYSRSEKYDPATGGRTPLDVNTSRGLVIHLPAGEGRCALKWADLDAGWDGAQLAADVWRWRQRRGLLA
jgi:hypothetical protein